MRSMPVSIPRGPALLVTSLFVLSAAVATAQPPADRSGHEVFAFCHDTHDARQRDLPQQAALLKQLGYDGAGHVGLEQIEQRLDSLDRFGLRLYLAGITVHLNQTNDQELAALQAALPLLKGRPVVIYAVLRGQPPRAQQGMPTAVAALRKICAVTAPAGIRVGIYPHTGDWVATVDQAVAVAENVNRKNCGVIFNLCHFLRNEPLGSLDETLEQAAPHLMAVTINGADPAGQNDKNWDRLIQPLDQGTFDVQSLLLKLDQHDYSGPVGIMCYGIGGDAEEHLGKSIKKWRQLTRKR